MIVTDDPGDVPFEHKHAGHVVDKERVRVAHSQMCESQWSTGEPSGHRVYNQAVGEMCYLCALLWHLDRAEDRVTFLEQTIRDFELTVGLPTASGYYHVAKEDVEILLAALENSLCDHEWVDMRNEVIESGEWCRKCSAIRAQATEMKPCKPCHGTGGNLAESTLTCVSCGGTGMVKA